MSDSKGTGIRSVILSALSAAFGVQKQSNLERDFKKGKPAHFIIAGLVGTFLFVIILMAIVRMVLSSA
ncbi:DUF2970 domain-containing protein [uncultured Endozoicomonas sp.]|uniref:DUF2970 domain-containing protein n=1 Tax=uncultured Endozoicomonas sp. TaxID=432652 RepID=UPI002631C1F3|nr:DUF2970 domain-containing protein [uncultured Endozoicomonas sp.]